MTSHTGVPGSPDRNAAAAVALILGVYLLFACLDTSVKYLALSISSVQVAGMRFLVHAVLAVVLLRPWRNAAVLVPRRPVLQGVRAVLLLTTTLCNFIAVHYLQLAQTVAIFFLGPFMVAALAGPMLGEWAGPRRWAAICVGFLGALLIVRPGTAGFQPAMLISIGSTVAFSLFQLFTRKLAHSESQESMIVLPAVLSALILMPAGIAVWHPVPSAFAWLLLLGTGVFGGFGHWLLIKAYRRAPTPVLAPFQYTQVIWMVGLGYLVFGDVPDRWTLAGIGVIVLSGLYLLYREYAVTGETLSEPQGR